jgi:hypothetical protein
VKVFTLWCSLFLLALVSRADACSCELYKGTPREQVQGALDRADAVFVARLRHSVVNPDPLEPRVLVEDAMFVVLEVIKGDLFLAQPVHINQMVSGGTCGTSSTNDPPLWMEIIQTTGNPDDSLEMPATFSKEWLIYAHGAEPWELSQCSRSVPMNHGGDEELKLLRELVQKSDRRR